MTLPPFVPVHARHEPPRAGRRAAHEGRDVEALRLRKTQEHIPDLYSSGQRWLLTKTHAGLGGKFIVIFIFIQ